MRVFLVRFLSWVLTIQAVVLPVAATAAECELVSEVCVDGPSTKMISGWPVTRACWKYEAQYNCLSQTVDTTDCDPLVQRGCGFLSSSCIETSDTGCSLYELKYQCEKTPGSTSTQANCGSQTFCIDGSCFDSGYTPDADFAKVIAGMEAMREAGTYIDPVNLTLLNGVPDSCEIKYWGLVNCCKAKGGGAPSNNIAFSAVKSGASAAYSYARSTYMYDALFQSDAPGWLLNGLYGGSTGMALNPTFGLYGFSASLGASAVAPVGSTVIASGPGYIVAFDPLSFAVSVVIQIALSALSCDQDDQQMAMRKSVDLCHTIGTYCSQKILGSCVKKKQSACCFNSKLARIINEQGRPQIGKTWGTPKSPQCTGFTAAELQGLDFSAMDFTEFYADIHATALDTQAIQNAVTSRLKSNPSYFSTGSLPAQPNPVSNPNP